MNTAQPNVPADHFLLMQLAKGNPWALESLMRRYESRIYHFNPVSDQWKWAEAQLTYDHTVTIETAD